MVSMNLFDLTCSWNEHNCGGVVVVIGAARTFVGLSSLTPSSRDRFGTLPYLTAIQ